MIRFIKQLAVAGFASLALLLGFLFTDTGKSVAQNVACYMTQGGAAWTAGSGCTWTVASGGTLAVASGGTFTVNGSAVLIARGSTVLDGSNPTYITTGLTTIAACALNVQGNGAPTVASSTHLLTYTGTTGQLLVYGWRPTSSNSSNLTASTATDGFSWICAGAN